MSLMRNNIEEMARECGLYVITARSHLGFLRYKFSTTPIKCWGEKGIEFNTPGEAREFLKNLKKTRRNYGT